MKKPVTIVLQVVGLILLGYGIYQVIVPEASVNIGPIDASVQDNNDAYVTMGLGLLSIGLGYFMGRNKQ
jgi:hypothetical protein